MGYQLWLSPNTGIRRKGTTFKELQTIFIDQITTKLICEPLYSCKITDQANHVKEELTYRDFDVVGVINAENIVIGFCKGQELNQGTIDLVTRNIELENVITDSTPICQLFSSLQKDGFVFVMSWNKIDGIVTIADINKPIVRIYLFGIISLFEMHINYWLDYYNKHKAWEEKLNPERLAKAKEIFELRKGNNTGLSLFECLQLADKRDILVNTADFVSDFGYTDKEIKRYMKDIEKIRNELAHSQNSIISNLEWSVFVNTITFTELFLKYSENRLEKMISEMLH